MNNNAIILFCSADNYIMTGYSEGEYHFVSPLLEENGPRLYYPHFGFAYRAKNTKVKALILEDGDPSKKHTMWDLLLDDQDSWNYLGKNLTEVTFLNDLWTAAAPVVKKWKLVLHFRVEYHGFILIDNLGKTRSCNLGTVLIVKINSGPCSMEEIFFPQESSSGHRIGSCYRVEVGIQTFEICTY